MSTKYPGNIITSGANAGYSVAFDGTGDYLSMSSGTSLGAGNFTIECWVYLTAAAASETTVGSSTNYYTVGFNGNFVFRVGTTNLWRSFDGQGSQATIDGSFTWSTGQWYHMAWVRNSGTVTVYRNGTSLGSVADSKTLSDSTNGYGIAATRQASSYSSLLTGYISNLRVVVGTALYTAAFTPPTQLLAITNTSLLTCNSPAIVDQSSNNFTITANGNAAVSTFTPFQGYVAYNPALGAATPGIWTVSDAIQAAQTRRWNMYDPYFQNTTLLLHGNGTNGAQNNTFLDSSSNNFTITRNGNTTQGTFSPFSQTGWSANFTGAQTSPPVTFPTNAAYSLGSTADFTVEMWVYFTGGMGSEQSIMERFDGTAGPGWIVGKSSSDKIWFGFAGSTYPGNTTVVTGKWYHVCWMRTGGNSYLFLDGVLDRAAVATTNFTDGTTPLSIGERDTGTQTFALNGYVSNIRIVKGTAVYSTSGFTVPTAPLTAITNTVLLTLQSNRFVDNSVTAATATVGSTASIQAFSPFAPTAAYSASTNGGSGYFDGTGDYLSITGGLTNAGTTDMCIEFFAYYTGGTFSDYKFAFDSRTSGGSFKDGIAIAANTSTGAWYVSWAGQEIVATAKAGAYWNHVCVTRQSGVFRLFVDGVLQGTYTPSPAFDFTSTANRIGNFYGTTTTYPWIGYITNVRSTKGSVPTSYQTTSTTTGASIFTPPSSPLTLTSQGASSPSLLALFTNAGVTDATGKNVLETVGNAQISTTQSKFGGSSISLPDTSSYSVIQNYNNRFDFGTGDFTIECWVYITGALSGDQYVIDFPASGALHVGINIFSSGWRIGGFNSYLITGSTGLVQNSWIHVAMVKQSGTLYAYINGTLLGSIAANVSFSATGTVYFGRYYAGTSSNNMTGYIDDLRVTKYARYTAAFTPQTSQWQDQ
jgi:hypothetical protein